eukprot:TRINITY_DN593_c0_g1_i1.p1 TRINITY_DN593_c0_g1~~TRINITY_DN593_c0_g1_i1.p1  ORF type:complete len:341 (-),score=85.15 TRINITY_DN593_c0_g1_i1:53-1075(-)
MSSPLDVKPITNLQTLTRFLLTAKNVPEDTDRIELSNLFTGITLACKITSNAIKRAGFEQLFGLSGQVNVHAEEVKKLDIVANDAFVTALRSTKEVCLMVSEEEEEALMLPQDQAGTFAIAFDPLDGSANLDANVSVGSIFSIFKRKSPADGPADLKDILRQGKEMIVGGYALYGSSTMLVLTLGKGVYGFTLDQAVGEFVLTHDNIKIKDKGTIYSINEGNSHFWDKGTAAYVNHIKNGDKKAPYSSRYIGSMVADVHRTLLYGGIFMYPADSKSPNGKLRYLYEVAPLSFIMEQAGGNSSTGKDRCLDISPSSIHQRVPVFMGSSKDVVELEGFHNSK